MRRLSFPEASCTAIVPDGRPFGPPIFNYRQDKPLCDDFTVLTGLILILIWRGSAIAAGGAASRCRSSRCPAAARRWVKPTPSSSASPSVSSSPPTSGSTFRRATQKNLSMMAATAFRPHVSAEHRAEIAALAGGGRAGRARDHARAVLPRPVGDDRLLDGDAPRRRRRRTASRASAATSTSRPSTSPTSRASCMIFRPQGRYAFASVAWPGMVGVLSGMNEHGLALANMEVDRERRHAGRRCRTSCCIARCWSAARRSMRRSSCSNRRRGRRRTT